MTDRTPSTEAGRNAFIDLQRDPPPQSRQYWDATIFAIEEQARAEGRQQAVLPTALHLLRRLVDYEDSPCRFDHHGYCQEHHLENPCTIREARDFLALRAAPSLPEPSDD